MTTLTPAELAVKNLLIAAFFVVIFDGTPEPTAYRVLCCDETSFDVVADNEDNPVRQTLQYSQVDLERDFIYKLELVNQK